MLSHQIHPSYLLNDPPELTREIAISRIKEINLLLHSLALIADELEGRRPLLPLLRTSASLAPADRVLLYQWDEVRAGVRLAAALGFQGALAAPLTTGNTQAHACLVHGKPILVSSPPEQHLAGELSLLGARSCLSVPIKHQGMPWGALQLLRDRPFLNDEAVLVWMFALVLEGMLPSVMGQRRHREIAAAADAESGLLAPAHFRRSLDWEVRRAARAGQPLTVACVEVTEMLHGRPRGGSIPFTPPAAARVIQRALREQDIATCLGGHHFLAALPDTADPAARQMVGLIREGLVELAAGTLPVFDIAAGFATYPDDGRCEADLIRAACASGRDPRAGTAGSTGFSRSPLEG